MLEALLQASEAPYTLSCRSWCFESSNDLITNMSISRVRSLHSQGHPPTLGISSPQMTMIQVTSVFKNDLRVSDSLCPRRPVQLNEHHILTSQLKLAGTRIQASRNIMVLIRGARDCIGEEQNNLLWHSSPTYTRVRFLENFPNAPDAMHIPETCLRLP